MKTSLPSVNFIGYLPCSELPPDLLLKYLSGMPIALFSSPTPIEHYGNASCEAVSEYDNGSRLEKTTLHFTTADNIPERQDIAFVARDAQDKMYIIGTKEGPFPMVEITASVDKDENIIDIKVVLSARKSLIVCDY